MKHYLAEADGVYHVLHTLSRRGTLFDPAKPQHLPPGMKLIGHEVPPVVIANQTMTQPWAPEWVANLVDEKPLPYYAQHVHEGRWRTCYLGRHYGIASLTELEGTNIERSLLVLAGFAIVSITVAAVSIRHRA